MTANKPCKPSDCSNSKYIVPPRRFSQRINSSSHRMGILIDDLLKLSRLTRIDMNYVKTNLSLIAESVIIDLEEREPERKVEFNITPYLFTRGDRALLRVMIKNLFNNAWKFTSNNKSAKIEFGKTNSRNEQVFYIKDNGIGFDMKFVDKLFEPFQRQHKGYEGTGIGLATVERIINRHGGRIWAEGKVDEGAIFFFSLRSKNS